MRHLEFNEKYTIWLYQAQTEEQSWDMKQLAPKWLHGGNECGYQLQTHRLCLISFAKMPYLRTSTPSLRSSSIRCHIVDLITKCFIICMGTRTGASNESINNYAPLFKSFIYTGALSMDEQFQRLSFIWSLHCSFVSPTASETNFMTGRCRLQRLYCCPMNP